MKIIVDMSEETYNAVIGDEWIDSEYIDNIIKAIQNGILLSEELKEIKAETIIDELEKIKAEIEYHRKKHNCGVLECLDIIDKEIKGAWRNRWRKGE